MGTKFHDVGRFDVQYILDQVPARPGTERRVNTTVTLEDGRNISVRISSTRLRMFKFKGITCVACGVVGTHFKVTETKARAQAHLNLFTETDMLMTMDHIIPQHAGGTHELINLQPMCQSCNSKKAGSLFPFTLCELHIVNPQTQERLSLVCSSEPAFINALIQEASRTPSMLLTIPTYETDSYKLREMLAGDYQLQAVIVPNFYPETACQPDTLSPAIPRKHTLRTHHVEMDFHIDKHKAL